MDKLKECPFCGCRTNAAQRRLEGWWYVECQGCLASTGLFPSRTEAETRWNSRENGDPAWRSVYEDPPKDGQRVFVHGEMLDGLAVYRNDEKGYVWETGNGRVPAEWAGYWLPIPDNLPA